MLTKQTTRWTVRHIILLLLLLYDYYSASLEDWAILCIWYIAGSVTTEQTGGRLTFSCLYRHHDG